MSAILKSLLPNNKIIESYEDDEFEIIQTYNGDDEEEIDGGDDTELDTDCSCQHGDYEDSYDTEIYNSDAMLDESVDVQNCLYYFDDYMFFEAKNHFNDKKKVTEIFKKCSRSFEIINEIKDEEVKVRHKKNLKVLLNQIEKSYL